MIVQTAQRMFLCPFSNTLSSVMSLIITKLAPTQEHSPLWSLTKPPKVEPKKTTWPKMMIMQEKKKDVQIQAMWFAAGTAAAMACLQRAVLVSVMEQWRMLVFLALNLLLLAILFTSTSAHNNNTINSISPTDGGGGGGGGGSAESEVEEEEKKWKKQTGLSPCVPADPPPAAHKRLEDGSRSKDRRLDLELLKCRSSKTEKVARVIVNETEDHNLKNDEGEAAHHQDQDQEQELSMEELNRRAEAFIAMFRQHLLSDAKVANSCRLQHPYSHAKGGEIFMSKSRANRLV